MELYSLGRWSTGEIRRVQEHLLVCDAVRRLVKVEETIRLIREALRQSKDRSSLL